MVWVSPCKPWQQLDENERAAARWFWTHGDLRYKLDPLQKQVRKKIDDYFAHFEGSTNSFARFYVLDMARRLGKDFIMICKMLEEMARNREHIYVYATATYKQLIEILEPMLKTILMDCPPDLKPEEKTSRHHWVHPVTGSLMKMSGIDQNPDALRGPRCDGAVITEAAFSDLEGAESAFLPQLLDNPEAWRIYGSTPNNKEPSHRWEAEIIPEAQATGNYSYHILDESPRYTNEQKEAAYDEFGGRDSDDSKQEYLCLHFVSESQAFIPEWQKHKQDIIVDSYKRPDVAHGYLGLDPGMSDLAGIPAGYFDFENDILVIERSEAEPGLNTGQLATLIKEIEKSLDWKDFGYFTQDGKRHSNPFKRVSDRDPRLIADMRDALDENGEPYGLIFEPAIKRDLVQGVKALRTRIARGKLRIIKDKNSKLIAQLNAATWNEQRTSPKKTTSKILGHFDIVMALVYLNRSIDETVNPFNPVKVYPQNYHVVEPIVPPTSGWHRERDSMGNFV